MRASPRPCWEARGRATQGEAARSEANMGIRSFLDWGKAKSAMTNAGETAMLRAAQFMALRAQQYAPVDTGRLHNSIIVQTSMGGSRINVMATAVSDDGAPYPVYVEFGHMAGSTFVAPNPFMRKALADTARAFPDICRGIRIQGPFGGSGVGHLGSTFVTQT